MRIRTIKPEFFTHVALAEAEAACGMPLRLAFIGLWCVADRLGRFRWEPKRLKIQILPWEDVDFEEVLKVLWDGGWLDRYEVPGEVDVGVVRSFERHQVINHREAPGNFPDLGKARMKARVATDESTRDDASNTTEKARVTTDESTRDDGGNTAFGGKEGRKGRERKETHTHTARADQPNGEESVEVNWPSKDEWLKACQCEGLPDHVAEMEWLNQERKVPSKRWQGVDLRRIRHHAAWVLQMARQNGRLGPNGDHRSAKPHESQWAKKSRAEALQSKIDGHAGNPTNEVFGVPLDSEVVAEYRGLLEEQSRLKSELAGGLLA